MDLRKEEDPYPPSLPKMGSPDMAPYGPLGTSSTEHFFGQLYPGDETNDFDGFNPENFFRDAIPLSHGAYGESAHPPDLTLDPSHSPTSSPVSSSNSSTQHQRQTSSNSSQSATFGLQSLVPDEAQMHGLQLQNTRPNPDSPRQPREPIRTDKDSDDRMDDMFDFDSAATSPRKRISMEDRFNKPIAGIAMPHHEQPPQRTERSTLQPQSKRHFKMSRSAASTPSSFKPHGLLEDSTACVPPDRFSGDPGPQHNLTYNPFGGSSTASDLTANAGFVGQSNFSNPQPIFDPPLGSFGPSKNFEPFNHPQLSIHAIPPKTRVETQIPITLTLAPMPPNVTRLHLPTRTMAKPKLLAKPFPLKSPDMLELDVMPVCASAMKRPDLCSRAFAMARGEDVSTQTMPLMQRSRSDESDTRLHIDRRIEPMEGGPISICDGCMLRERKRANRRMEKEATDEDIRWREGEKERIVVFNETEIVDWKPYGSTDLNEPAGKRTRGARGKKKDEASQDLCTSDALLGPVVPYPELAGQLRLLMRITCYCRHQGESEGFQVILTLRDHLGRCVAQQISTPILITDDHKTSVNQHEGTNTAMADGLHPYNRKYPLPMSYSHARKMSQPFALGQSHSTTDLPMYNPNPIFTATHRASTFVSLQQHAPVQGSQSTGLSTPSRDLSHRTSATMTPRNLSRQVSPSATSGPTPKRRKASGSSGVHHRPLVDLSMTVMQPAKVDSKQPSSPSTSPDSASATSDGLFMAPAVMPFLPPTRDTVTDRGPFEPPLTSDTYNLPLSGSNRTADAAMLHQSHRQSPQPVYAQPLSDMAAHAQALHNSLLDLPEAAPSMIAPRMTRVIPSEGPKAGGIEVTILGEGFHQGLDVLFADAVATETTFLHSKTMVCVIPPSSGPNLVRVTLRGRHQPDPQVWFRYKDTDCEDLMSLALSVFHHRHTGNFADPSDIARSIIGAQSSQDNQQLFAEGQQPQTSAFRKTDIELSILGVIDVIDQVESVIAPRYSVRQPNGQTMLHVAASLGYDRLVAGLLARGVNPDLRDRNGMSAMHMACLRGYTKVVRKLLSAGGDPTVRSLLGLAPIDMATTAETYEMMHAVARHTRSRSAGTTPISYLSRASSTTSVHSTWASKHNAQASLNSTPAPYSNAMTQPYTSGTVTPAEPWTCSRRSSVSSMQRFLPNQRGDNPETSKYLLGPPGAPTAWADNLAGQVQQLQESVQRTFPNLQIPNLPPLPRFEAYHEHPMVRRISSLVQRGGSQPAPPAYDELFPRPAKADTNVDVKKASAARAVGDAFVDEKCAANFDPGEAGCGPLIQATRSTDQQEELGLVRAGKVNSLSSDPKLFFIWIPLLIIVLLLTFKDSALDWAPRILRGPLLFITATWHYLMA